MPNPDNIHYHREKPDYGWIMAAFWIFVVIANVLFLGNAIAGRTWPEYKNTSIYKTLHVDMGDNTPGCRYDGDCQEDN